MVPYQQFAISISWHGVVQVKICFYCAAHHVHFYVYARPCVGHVRTLVSRSMVCPVCPSQGHLGAVRLYIYQLQVVVKQYLFMLVAQRRIAKLCIYCHRHRLFGCSIYACTYTWFQLCFYGSPVAQRIPVVHGHGRCLYHHILATISCMPFKSLFDLGPFTNNLIAITAWCARE